MRKTVYLNFLAVAAFSAHAFATTQFGINGRDGRPGEDGQDGRSGFSTSIVATGQTATFNLDGEDASDGMDGENGENASSCSQPTPADNLVGAPGGAGGIGGRAGNGGNGGDITIYATDASALNRVLVSSRPGQGARSGRSGFGAKGCECTTPSWTQQQCHNVQDPNGTTHSVCENVSFTCANGSFGQNGANQNALGNPGQEGHLIWIHQLSDPSSDNPSVSVAFPEAFTSSNSGGIALSKNIWSTQSGALQLLAPGSVISDDYRSFDGQKQMTALFTWSVQRPIADFNDVTLSASLNDSGTQIQIGVSDGVWARVEQITQGTTTHFNFTRMLYESEATQLKMQFTGTSASDLAAAVVDSTDASQAVSTSFYAHLEIPGFLFWSTKLFDGPVPSDLVKQNGRSFSIDLAKLPGLDTSKIQPGKTVKLKLTANRSLDAYSTSQEMDAKLDL